jgi:hypothetical protein
MDAHRVCLLGFAPLSQRDIKKLRSFGNYTRVYPPTRKRNQLGFSAKIKVKSPSDKEGVVKYVQALLSFVATCALLTIPATLVARDEGISIPQGTVISVRTIDSISSDQNHVGETFRGSIVDAIRIRNQTVVPRGATVYMKLVDVSSAGRVKGRSELMLQLERIVVNNHSYPVTSNVVAFRGKSESKKTAKSAGIGALAGGGLGALFGGGKGAAIGAGVGAGAGVATNAAKKGEQVRIGSESLLRFRLAAPLRIR